ncbi:hypothetical protein DB30_01356 [Enhygromyxa salina]|uniref:Uncharacterized protein n=1 Tax=Enhygromyxa salina TaxID=215803 RepID=A0A0C2DF40_9BACT|nr:hypothetical protein [Enhygromyxa salina]KIG18247.1 hypothetical protein DB30_01356 [Enhygromyxa salina]
MEVSVDTSALEHDLGKRLGDALDDELAAALRQQGLEVVRRSGDARIEARVELLDYELREYAITLELVLHGEREVLIKGLVCAGCAEAMVIRQTLAVLPVAVQRIELQTRPESESRPQPASPARRLGALGITGIAGMSGGIGGVIAGSVLVARSPTIETSKQSGQAQGAALVGVGVAAALLGVTALAFDLTVFDRQRRERNVFIQVDATPTSAGVWLSGRF